MAVTMPPWCQKIVKTSKQHFLRDAGQVWAHSRVVSGNRTGKRRRLLLDAEGQQLHRTYMCYNAVYADLWVAFTEHHYFDFW